MTTNELIGYIQQEDLLDPTEAEQLIDKALKPLSNNLTEVGRDQLYAYVRTLMIATPVIVVVPAPTIVAGHAQLSYTHIVLPTVQIQARPHLSKLLWIEPAAVHFPLNLMFSTKIYDLKISGPSDSFLSSQNLVLRNCGRHISLRRCRAEAASHLRFQAEQGQEFAHFNVNGAYSEPIDELRNLDLAVKFTEVPPGSVGLASATSMMCTILVGTLGYLVSTGANTSDSDIPALILAFPAAAAAWLRFGPRSPSLIGPSILARLSQTITASVSIFAIITYFTRHFATLPYGIRIAGITHTAWAILFVASATNFVLIASRLLVTRIEYSRMLRRAIANGHLSETPEPTRAQPFQADSSNSGLADA